MQLIRNLILILLLFWGSFTAGAQSKLVRVEPPNWWAGMQDSTLQLMIYGDNAANWTPYVSTGGFTVQKVVKTDNPRFLFLYLTLSKRVIPGTYPIQFQMEGKTTETLNYQILPRKEGSALRKGFDRSDNIYLIMPDRFANGNPANDSHPQMLEKANRSHPDGRHGGDIEGIRSKLDYLKDLGMTALWLNPVLENNQPAYSYHGYAITDLYRTDPRIGTNEEYRSFILEAQQKGFKIIMDMVFNHLGDEHWMIKDLPEKNWIHQWPEFTRSNFRAPAIPDPYRSETDNTRMVRGWFDRHMPDLDQTRPLLADYLIQNSLWWIEYAGLDGIRMDTHQYADKDFMANWLKRIRSEYPFFSVVGECWVEQKSLHAYWTEGANNRDGYESGLEYITDFPLYIATRESFNDPSRGWEKGVERLYYCLAQDHLYKEPMNNMVFLDNHDLSRFFSVCGGDMGKFTLGLSFLYTVRGVPQLFYGTEILMKGYEHDGHGPLRADFPGGWKNDQTVAFESHGRNKQQQKAWELVSRLAHWRLGKEVIHSGKTRHFIPENDVYCYFRYNDTEKVWVILNYGNQPHRLETGRFREMLGQSSEGREVISGQILKWSDSLNVPAHSALIIEINP